MDKPNITRVHFVTGDTMDYPMTISEFQSALSGLGAGNPAALENRQQRSTLVWREAVAYAEEISANAGRLHTS